MKLTKLLMIILALFLFTGAATIIVNAQNQKSDEKKTEKEKDDDDDDREENDSAEAQMELAKQAKISLEEGRGKTLERVSGDVLESELEREKGRLVYEFEIRDKNSKVQEVLVDADTGEIIGVEEESENDDEEDKPKSQAKTDKGKWYEFWRRIPGL